jgi:hypothetical protein
MTMRRVKVNRRWYETTSAADQRRIRPGFVGKRIVATQTLLRLAIRLVCGHSAIFVLPVDAPFAEARCADLTVRESVLHISI